MKTFGSFQSAPSQKKSKTILEFALIIAIFCLAIIILSPRHWEQGGESWNKWAEARIFKETGEFPPYAMGPLYEAYLIPFSLLKYPLSTMVEYWITHLFAYFAIYLLLQKFIHRAYAMLLTIAWIPHLAIVEPGNTLIGVGLLCLYFIPKKSPLRNEGYFPPTLVAATLFHTVYFLFLMGHIIGTYLEKRHLPPNSLNEPKFQHNLSSLFSQHGIALALKTILLTFILLMIIAPASSRPDHNHMLMDPTYAPIPLEKPIDMAFFQLGTERFVRRTFPENEWVYQDWYFSTPKAYDNATTLTQAIIRRPDTVLRNFITNVGTGVQLPLFFLTGSFLGPIGILFILYPLFGLLSLYLKLRSQQHYAPLCTILIGTLGALAVLSLTTFNHSRYIITLLPVAFLIILYTTSGFSTFAKYWITKLALKKPEEKKKRINFKITLAGFLLILVGILFNPKTLNKIILPYKVLPSFIRIEIIIIDILLILTGITLFLFSKRIEKYIHTKKEQLKDQRQQYIEYINRKESQSKKYIIIASTILLLLTIQYPAGTINQFESLWHKDSFLSGEEPLSMVNSYPQLQKYLTKDTIVLARENAWITAFTEVKLDNVHQIWSLPPFKDPTNKTVENLENMEIILVSSLLESDKPNIGTQTYPRYIFNIKPFLESHKQEWSEEKIEGYGTVYIKKK